MDTFIEYAPLVIVVLFVMYVFKVVVTPEQLEKKHREIVNEVENKFVTWAAFKELKDQFKNTQDEVHAIYEHFIGGK